MFTNKEEVLENALRVFAKMNYEKASQMEIAKACGLSKAGLIYYFPLNLTCLCSSGQIRIQHPAVGKQVQIHGRFVFGVYRPICRGCGKYHEPPCAHA